MNQINLSAFAASNDTERLGAAMAYLREHPGTELIIPPGVYEITTPLAREAMENVMTGVWGRSPQKVMFRPEYRYSRGVSLDGQHGSVISAYGATFMVNGFMEPLSIINCSDVEVRGLTIDHKRKPFSRGRFTQLGAPDENGLRDAVIVLDDDCPICEGTPVRLRALIYDAEAGRDLLTVGMPECRYEDSHHLRVKLSEAADMREGTLYYTVHTYHSRPAILIENAKNVRLTDVTIHSQPGMGVVGNRSEDIVMTRLAVVPAEGYHMSTNTDATHFTSIRGLLRFEDCVFDGQGDDFTNVHGYYQAVMSREGEKTYCIQEKTPDGTHACTLDYPDVGDTLELVRRTTLEVVGTYTVEDCVPMPEEWMCRVTLSEALPEDTEGLVLADITRLPRLECVGCRASHHFARSILTKTRSTLVEGCTFTDVQGPAVVASAEATWSEGVSPENVIVRGNRVTNCAAGWGEAAGVVVMTSSEDHSARNIRNVVIENNIITAPNCEHGIYVSGVDGLRIRDNVIVCRGEPIVVENCGNIE